MRRLGAAVAAVWVVALVAGGVFAYRMASLPPKGSVRPGDVSVLAATSSPGVPPDPGRGPLPACWVVPGYVTPAGDVCPPRPHR